MPLRLPRPTPAATTLVATCVRSNGVLDCGVLTRGYWSMHNEKLLRRCARPLVPVAMGAAPQVQARGSRHRLLHAPHSGWALLLRILRLLLFQKGVREAQPDLLGQPLGVNGGGGANDACGNWNGQGSAYFKGYAPAVPHTLCVLYSVLITLFVF